MVLSVSSPQSKAEEKGSTLRNLIGHYLDFIGSFILDCSTRLATVSSAPECSSSSLDYFEYAAYVMKRRKGATQTPRGPKLSSCRSSAIAGTLPSLGPGGRVGPQLPLNHKSVFDVRVGLDLRIELPKSIPSETGLLALAAGSSSTRGRCDPELYALRPGGSPGATRRF